MNFSIAACILHLRVIARNEAIPDCADRTCKCEYHVQPLIAAEATTFVLIQKVAKTDRRELMNTIEEQIIDE